MSGKITLQQLHLFVQVCEKGSFNRAAQAVYLSQAAVSQHIHRLEKALGSQLFERTPQGTKQTISGRTLYDYATKILDLTAEAEQAISQLNEKVEEPLTIGATPGLSVYVLPDWLKTFQSQFPNTPLSLQTDSTRAILQEIQNGRLDFAFFVGNVSDLNINQFQQLWLQEISYKVVMTPKHPFAQGDTVSLDQLAQAPFLARQPHSRFRAWLDQTMSEQGITLRPIAEMDNPGVIKYALLSGLGISILPEYTIQREVDRGELCAKPVSNITLTRPVYLVWSEKRPFNTTQKSFLQALAQQLPPLQTIIK